MKAASATERDLLAAWVGEGIDAITTLDFRHHDLVRALYRAARGTGDPTSVRAAQLLRDRVEPGAEVIVSVGFPVYPVFVGETDGICGAAVLAHVLSAGLRARPVLVTEEAIAPFVKAALAAASLDCVTGLEGGRTSAEATRLVPCVPGPGPGRECSLALLERRPAAVLAVEKAGINRVGVPHSSGGTDLGEATAYLEELFRGAERLGIPTVGIGDQGNELGMGAIADTAAAITQYGSTCRCPCNQGTASGVPADITVIGGTSDWGAFGVAAALAFLLDRPDVLPAGETIKSIIRAAVAAGAIDAVTRTAIPRVDGYTADLCARIADLLCDAITTPGRFAEMEPERYRAGIARLRAASAAGAKT